MRILIKIGTNVLVQKDGRLDQNSIKNIVSQISELTKQHEIILVSSGAMGAGKGVIKEVKNTEVIRRQVLSAVGQIKLMEIYRQEFSNHHLNIGQALVTKHDFNDRQHYLNMRNCIDGLIKQGIIPIVNENDVVSIQELMFSDNDELSSLLSIMNKVDRVIFLTSVDGLYAGSPEDPNCHIIPEVHIKDEIFLEGCISNKKSSFGRGGMQTKVKIALELAKVGIKVHFAHGQKENILIDVINNKKVGTIFIPEKHNLSAKKRWLASSPQKAKGKILVNNRAEEVLKDNQKIVSLLPVGIIDVVSNFEKGDLVEILNENQQKIGLGISEYNSVKLEVVLGKKGEKPAVHYDSLLIF